MENQLLLPQEVAQIAEGVSVEKRTEVEAVLAHVFNGVQKMRDQLDGVVVADENDNVSMKIANTIRLAVRQTRLNAEKKFDAKRAEVQQQMLSYKTEDKLWLRSKQIMQDLTKEIEETARWKEETAKRFEAEQCELKTQNRMLQVSKFAPEITRPEFEYMSDETFSSFVLTLEKTYNDRIEAERKAEEKRIADEKKAEEERIAREEAQKLHEERKNQILPYWNFIPLGQRSMDFSTLSEAEWKDRFDWTVSEKQKDDDAKEVQRIENERLKKEAEEKEALLKAEQAKAAAEKKKAEEKAETERKAAADKLKAEQEVAAAAAKKAADEKAALQAQIKAKEEAEEKARKEAEEAAEAERKAKEDVELKAKNAPDKEKLLAFAETLKWLPLPELQGQAAKDILGEAILNITLVYAAIEKKCAEL